jgi:subtilisin family serine protease
MVFAQNTSEKRKFLIALDDASELAKLKIEPFQVEYEKTFNNAQVSSELLKKVYSVSCLNCRKMNPNNPTNQIHPLDETNFIKVVKEQINSLIYVEHDIELEPLSDKPSDYDSTSVWSWAFDKDHLNFFEAWEQLLPSDPTVKVAVLDWNLDFDHIDMCANIDTHDGLPALYQGHYSGDFTPTTHYEAIHNHFYDGDPDCGFNGGDVAPYFSNYNTHGNMVTSIIAAEADNGIGIPGMAYNKAKISFYQAQNTSIFNAILDAANKGITVINLSFATGMTYTGYSETFQEVINEAYTKGLLIVAAAGNFGLTANNGYNISAIEHVFPASFSNVLSVTLSGNDETGVLHGKNLIKQHNTNRAVDITAGGHHMQRLDYQYEDHILIDRSSGTSSAAPVVTALAALIKSVNPALNNKQIEYIIKATAKNIYNESTPETDNSVTKEHKGLGAGLVNAGEAVKMARTFDGSTAVPYCLITKNNRAFISANKQNNSVEFEGIAEGGTITWSHTGRGTLKYPGNNPNATNATYYASADDYAEVMVIMTVTKNDAVYGDVTYESYAYITISDSEYGIERLFCSVEGQEIHLSVLDLNMSDDYRYKEYEYIWELSNSQAGTLTANGTSAVFIPSSQMNQNVSITVYARPYRRTSTNPIQKALDSEGLRRRIMVFRPSSTNLPEAEKIILCGGNKIGIEQQEGISYSWFPSFGLTNPYSSSTFAEPEEPTTYILTCTSQKCASQKASYEFEIKPTYYKNKIAIVSKDEVWEKNASYRDAVIIKSGATLTIKNATIRFGADVNYEGHYPQDFNVTKGIVVEEGAKLILENATLTARNFCDGMFWGGIEVRSLNGKHGEVVMKNSSIEYANVGIYFGKKYHDFLDVQIPYNGSGLAKIENSEFKHNLKSMVFTTSQSSSSTNRVELLNNMFATNYNEDGFETDKFISITESHGILISGNTFIDEKINTDDFLELTTNPFSVEAIHSFNSNINVIGNTFINLKSGVNAYGLGGSKSLVVKNNTFNYTYSAISLQGVPYAEISNNTIVCFNPNEDIVKKEWKDNVLVEYPSYAVFSAASPGTLIFNNMLTALPDNNALGMLNISRGIIIQNSGEGGATISNNSIEGFGVAMEVQYDNPKLRFTCNEFIDNNNGVFLNIGTEGLLAHQSSTCSGLTNNPEEIYFPNNQFIVSPTKENVFSHIYTDHDVYSADGNRTRYIDDSNTENRPELIAEGIDYSVCASQKSADKNKKCYIEVADVYSVEKLKQTITTLTDEVIKTELKNKVIRYYLHNNQLNEAIDFVKNINTDEAKRQLIAMYYELGEKEKASQLLKTLPTENNERFIELFEELLTALIK